MSIMPTDFRAIEARLPITAEPWRLELLKAAERIATRGHTKNETVCLHTGANCFVGAILNATPDNENGDYNPEFNKIWNAMRPRVGRDLVQWNNDPATTAQEVITTMIEVALAP